MIRNPPCLELLQDFIERPHLGENRADAAGIIIHPDQRVGESAPNERQNPAGIAALLARSVDGAVEKAVTEAAPIDVTRSARTVMPPRVELATAFGLFGDLTRDPIRQQEHPAGPQHIAHPAHQIRRLVTDLTGNDQIEPQVWPRRIKVPVAAPDDGRLRQHRTLLVRR